MEPKAFSLLKSIKVKSILVFITLVLGCSSKNDSLYIATAANMQMAMEELINDFKEETGIDTEIILGSSGKLTAQIQAGAPFDLFFSADTKHPQKLYELKLTDAPKIYAYGQLVFWKKDNIEHLQLFVLPNPKTAPYGKATVEYLKNSNKKHLDVVYGESVTQVNQFLLSGTVDAGYTSLSSMQNPAFETRGSYQLLADSLYCSIEQAFVSIHTSQKKSESKAFIDFLNSSKGKAILEKYGYRIN